MLELLNFYTQEKKRSKKFPTKIFLKIIIGSIQKNNERNLG